MEVELESLEVSNERPACFQEGATAIHYVPNPHATEVPAEIHLGRPFSNKPREPLPGWESRISLRTFGQQDAPLDKGKPACYLEHIVVVHAIVGPGYCDLFYKSTCHSDTPLR